MITYLVCGRTGEYSDAIEWRVRAFVSKSAAEELTVRLKQLVAEVVISKATCYYDENRQPLLPRQLLELDPQFLCDSYTGVEYWVEELEVI